MVNILFRNDYWLQVIIQIDDINLDDELLPAFQISISFPPNVTCPLNPGRLRTGHAHVRLTTHSTKSNNDRYTLEA